jgi:hypothetical protein
MFWLGIVGNAEDKFTKIGQEYARIEILRLIVQTADLLGEVGVISGDCHLGGVDQWAREQALRIQIPFKDFPPKIRKWEGGYKQRNIQIAEESNEVYSIVADTYPPNYKGMRFKLCYHCGTNDHVKSGGCWTAKYARSLGKVAKTLIVPNDNGLYCT